MSAADIKTPKGFRAIDEVRNPVFSEAESADGQELWLIRVPNDFRAKSLRGLELNVSRVEHPNAQGRVTKFSVEDGPTYEFFLSRPTDAIPSGTTRGGAADDDGDDDSEDEANNDNGKDGDATARNTMGESVFVAGDQVETEQFTGGQEMHSLIPLIPNAEGILQLSTKPITRHLVLQTQYKVPDNTAVARLISERPFVKRQQPAGIEFRFRPNGFNTGGPNVPQQTKPRPLADSAEEPRPKKLKKEKKSRKEKKSKKAT